MKIVFVGCNITNLIIATLIVFLTKYKVIIVEKSNEIGGNYKSLNVNNLKLDLGMRLLYSSNIPFIDKFYKKIFYKKFYFLKKEKKDLAGIIYNKNIFHKSNYLDLSGLNKIKKKLFLIIF